MFVKAEYAEIEATLELEKENSKHGWKDLIATPGALPGFDTGRNLFLT